MWGRVGGLSLDELELLGPPEIKPTSHRGGGTGEEGRGVISSEFNLPVIFLPHGFSLNSLHLHLFDVFNAQNIF